MIYTIYSKPKVGKTTLAMTGAPKGRTAIIDADGGLIGTDTTGIKVIHDLSAGSLNKEVLSPSFLKAYDRIIIDTATSLYDAFLMEITGGRAPSQSSYGQANTGMSQLIRGLRIQEKQVIILCQEKMVLPDDDWMSDDDDEEVSASVTTDLPPGAAKTLLTMADVIGRLYIANVNNKPARRLWLCPTANIVAGARSKKYHGTPPYLTKPSITRINQLLGWKA